MTVHSADGTPLAGKHDLHAYPFRMICPSCGTVAPEGARFCPGCGHALAAATARGDQRRLVTVLFADLVGYTALAETRDPEQVKNIVDRCFERLAGDVVAHGGRVDKIVGDAIMALFGAPLAHEDDAERAVRAGLQMQRTIEAWSAEQGVDIQMRVGINSGEVLVGEMRAGGDYTAMGDVVNTASRLQTAAEPGQVLVGHVTHAATREVVRYGFLGQVRTPRPRGTGARLGRAGGVGPAGSSTAAGSARRSSGARPRSACSATPWGWSPNAAVRSWSC